MRTILVLAILFVFAQCKKAVPPFGVEFVSVETARDIIDQTKELKIIDVRTPEEASEGMIEGATVIDIRNENFDTEISKLKRDETYLVYCRSGSRSTMAVEKMAELGFDRVYMMEGGYLDWKESEQ